MDEIPEWLAENYRQLVNDPNRADSFVGLAERSDGALAAWARSEAEKAGESVTPAKAVPRKQTTREG